MRQANDVLAVLEALRRKIRDVGAQLARIERLCDRIHVDDRLASEVQDDRAVAHQAHAVPIDQRARLVIERNVDRDDIRMRKQVIEIAGLRDPGRKLPCVLNGNLRIVTNDIHAQAERRVRDLDAYRSEPNDPERAPRQLETDESFLAALDGEGDILVGTVEIPDEAGGRQQIACRDEHGREHELFNRVGVGAGRVEYRYASLAEVGDGNIVDARARARHSQRALRNLHVMHVVGAQQIGVGLGYLRADFVSFTRQTPQSAERNVIQSAYLEHCRNPSPRLPRTAANPRGARTLP